MIVAYATREPRDVVALAALFASRPGGRLVVVGEADPAPLRELVDAVALPGAFDSWVVLGGIGGPDYCAGDLVRATRGATLEEGEFPADLRAEASARTLHDLELEYRDVSRFDRLWTEFASDSALGTLAKEWNAALDARARELGRAPEPATRFDASSLAMVTGDVAAALASL